MQILDLCLACVRRSYLTGKYSTFFTIAWPSSLSVQSMNSFIAPAGRLRVYI